PDPQSERGHAGLGLYRSEHGPLLQHPGPGDLRSRLELRAGQLHPEERPLIRFLSPLLIVLCAGTAALAAVPAQDPGLPPEDPRHRPAARPNFTNRVNVRIEQAVDQEDPILRRSLNPRIDFQDGQGNEGSIDVTTLYRFPERRPE